MRKALAVGLVLLCGLALAILATLSGVRPASALAADAAPSGGPLDAETTSVRILLGLGDQEPTSWKGKVEVDQGEIVALEPWRFRAGSRVTGPLAWESRSMYTLKSEEAKARYTTKKGQGQVVSNKGLARNAAMLKDSHGGAAPAGPAIVPTGLIVRLKAPADATLKVNTEHGTATIALADIASGAAKRYLDGKVEARRVPSVAPLVEGPGEQDFPAAVADGKGGAWVVYVEHQHRGPEVMASLNEPPKSYKSFVPEGGGDQVKLIHFDGKRPGAALDVTAAGLDVWRPSVALDGRGRVVLAWAEQVDSNWDIYSREFDPAGSSWSERRRLTQDRWTDTGVVLASAPDGNVWMAWQAWLDGQAEIFVATVDGPGRFINVSDHPANDWSPAIAVDRRGVIHVAFDSYRAGNYDVMLASGVGNGSRPRLLKVAGSPRFEARPSLAVDRQGRVWVGYEERAPNWGKDQGRASNGEGFGLYNTSAVRVRCVDGERVLEGGDPVTGLADAELRMNSHARIALDESDRLWLLYRHRQEAIMSDILMTPGGVWTEYATCLTGSKWSTPQPMPRSDGLLDNRPALVAEPGGTVLAFQNTDNRMYKEVERNAETKSKYIPSQGTPPGAVANDLFVAALVAAKASGSGELAATPGGAPAAQEPSAAVHADEAGDLARIRAYRINAAGKTYQLLRGEFHRHSELSFDGGTDGTLEDLWRYAIDAGGLDWMGDGDHDNGGGKAYTWWLVQKTTDMYHNAPSFVPMFTYERSVSYPGGHRNVMFPYRGVRTLPRLVDGPTVKTDVKGRDEDALMLYAYLHELGGICAAHTTATNMGTDWRENDPKVEPIVEIYQGARESYESLGSPRSARRADDAAGGWRPLGMVWNALALQYRLGFQSSSDHISTHISYAITLAEEPTRRGIFEAFGKRHCYAATDNIILDVRSGDHLMGDEFDASGPVTLKVTAQGTGLIKRIDIVKDFVYAFSTEPKNDRVTFTWTDEERGRPNGLSWYYVRVEQEDGELAWGSPMWVHSGR